MSNQRSWLTRKRSATLLAAGLGCAITLSTGCHSMKSAKEKAYSSVRSIFTSSYHDPDAEEKMAKAEALFEEERYAEAKEIFSDLSENTYNPVLLAEKARYLEAESLRLMGKTFEAATHYNRMLNDFPAGAYRERGCHRLYDISYNWLKESTLDVVELRAKGMPISFKDRLPGMPNPFDQTRPLIDQEGEALRFLDSVHTHDLTGPTADKALFWCGYVNFYRGRFDEADHYFSQIVEMHKDSPLWEESLRLAVISKNNSTGGAVYDSSKASEALQLVHHAEAVIPEYVNDQDKSAWLTRQKMAVMLQLAEKDFRMAEYYERTKRPASAYFYYEMVTRRYAGTKFASKAEERLQALSHIKAQREADRENGVPSTTWDAVRQEWQRLTGLAPSEEALGGLPTVNDAARPLPPIGVPGADPFR